MFGLVAGVAIFAEAWVGLAGFVESGAIASATLADLLHVPFWALTLALVVVALATFALVQKLEGAGRRWG
jgi:hypothetical protein